MSVKAQESFSFIIAAGGAMLLMLLLTIPMINHDIESSLIISQVLEAEDLIETLGDSITRAYLGGNGTEEHVILSSNLEFEINIVPKYLAIVFYNRTKTKHVIANNLDEEVVRQGEYLIRNEGGYINVTQITDYSS